MEAIGFYLLRTPRLPLRAAEMLNGNRGEPEMDAALKASLDDPALRDALAYASPALCRKVQQWHSGSSPALTPRLRQTLYKYVLRTATRPTPYGLFAGVSCGTVTDAGSAICLAPSHSPVIRPDMAVWAAIVRQLHAEPSIRHGLTYHTNNTLADTGREVRYYAYRNRAHNRIFNQLRMENSRLLAMVTSWANAGIGYPLLVSRLLEAGLSGRQADAYIHTLLHHQVLLTDLEPSVSGVANGWARHTAGTHTALTRILKAAAGLKPGGALLVHNDIAAQLDVGSEPVFQCDMLTGTAANRLNKKVTDTIVSEIRELLPLNRQRIPPEMHGFLRRFTARYGDRWVPVLEALDTERGVGYGNDTDSYKDQFPLIDDLHFPPPAAAAAEPTLDAALNAVCGRWTGQHEVELTRGDLLAIEKQNNGDMRPLPPTFYVMGSLLANHADALDRGKFRFHLAACGGCSALPLMARFAHLDEELEDRLRGIAAHEQLHYGDAALAEIVHLPADRHGNILQRPHLRHYEIPIYTPSTLPEDQRIGLGDLWVTVRGEEVVLYSARLRKHIIPRLASAHNPTGGMSLYRFLCHVQYTSGSMDMSWQWGALARLAFLPRVTYRHLVLSRARWRLPQRSVPPADARNTVAQLQNTFNLPSRVMLAEGDQELFLDLDQPLAAELLAARLNKGDALLYECLVETTASPVIDRSGQAYANELIIPVRNRCSAPPAAALPESLRLPQPTHFAPGSEWLYFKCYTGPREAEGLLLAAIGPLVKRWQRSGWIASWFFVRYRDPQPHLRIRVRVAEPASHAVQGQLMGEFHRLMDRYMPGRGVHNWQLDTYQPEVERYHPGCMACCESIFHIDSRTVLALLPHFAGSGGEQRRWLVACAGTAMLLETFGYTVQECRAMTTEWRDAFFDEFGAGKKLRVALDKRYRELCSTLERFMAGHSHMHMLRALHIRSQLASPMVAGIRNRLAADHPGRLANVAASLVHMFINRLFYANQRQNELVVYQLLAKHFTSLSHRPPVSGAPSLPLLEG